MIGPRLETGRAPAAAAAVAFAAGIGLGGLSVSGALPAVLLAVFCGLLLAGRALRGERGAVSRVAFALAWASAGFIEGRLRIAAPAELARESFRLLSREASSGVAIEGVLTDFWVGSPPRAHGRMRAERIRLGSWHPFPAEVIVFVSGETPVEPLADRGDRVTLVGHLTAEGPPASKRDISLPWPLYRLSVKSALRLERRGGTLLSLATLPNRWLYAKLPAAGSRGADFDRDVRGPLAALLLGRTSELDRGMVARYRRGGLYHLLVVSGLHVALAVGLALGVLRVLRVRGKLRDAALLGTILLFVLVGGANAPAVRAGLVFGIFFLTRLLERPIAPLQAIGLSALLLLGVSPVQMYSVGTVLTFAAVFGIALLTAPIRQFLPARPGALFSGLATALAAQAATAPVLLWRFNVLSAAAWLTAPLSVPLSGALIALGALLLLFFAAGIFPLPLCLLFALGSRTLEFLAERASGVAFLRPTPPLTAVLCVSLLTLAAAAGPRRLRTLAASSAALLFFFLAVRPGPPGPPRGFSLEALDVGQGDALLLRWRDHVLLVDGGGPFDLDARDFGRTRLLPKLLDRGVTRLDAAILTHPHPDHALGLFAVLEELPVGVFWRAAGQDEGDLFRGLEEVARRRAIPVAILPAGRVVRWGDARLTVLHSGGLRRKLDATNNQSLVALFERDGKRALLTGDAGAPTESELLARGLALSADILKVGHHGSRGSTTREFLSAVAPRVALISCGRENRFGHPAPETLRALREARVPLFRTDLCSDIRLELSPSATHLWYRGLP
ncbi:MAG: DNA internalization-related competence protein ComEC/Rec2 [Thermoanaerobaculia bacterium]